MRTLIVRTAIGFLERCKKQITNSETFKKNYAVKIGKTTCGTFYCLEHRIYSNNGRGLPSFALKRGDFSPGGLIAGGDYFKYCSQEVVP